MPRWKSSTRPARCARAAVPADLRVLAEGPDGGHRHRTPGALARPPDRLRLEGHLRLGRAQDQEAQPRAQPQRRLHPAVRHHGDDVAAHPGHRPDDGRQARQVDVDLERLRWQCREVTRRPERALRCRAAFRRAPGRPATPAGSAPRADLGLLARVPAGPAEPGARGSARRSPTRSARPRSIGMASSYSRVRSHSETPSRSRRKTLTGRAGSARAGRCRWSGPSLSKGCARNGGRSRSWRERGAGAVEVELVEAPGPGRDELARHEIPWVEGLQRVLDDDGVAGPSRRGADRVVHHVEQLAHRDRRWAGLVRALVVAAVGDDEVLARGQQRVEQELAVFAARVAVADPRVLRGEVVAVALDVAREAAVVEPEQADDPVGDGAHGHERAHGQVAGAEVGPRRPCPSGGRPGSSGRRRSRG